jgi:hypothetical protein
MLLLLATAALSLVFQQGWRLTRKQQGDNNEGQE